MYRDKNKNSKILIFGRKEGSKQASEQGKKEGRKL